MDFAGLAKVYSADGPFVSAYLDTHAQVENGAAVRETAWKNAVRILSESSIDDATIQMLTPLVLDETPAGGMRVIIASPSQIHIAKWMSTPPMNRSLATTTSGLPSPSTSQIARL